MKKILFVTKLSEESSRLSYELSKYFQVQQCSENADVLRGMMSVVTPDMVIMKIEGTDSAYEEIFYTLYSTYPNVPVLSVASDEDIAPYLRYHQDEQFKRIGNKEPLENIYNKCCEMLSVASSQMGIAGNGKKSILVVDDNPLLLRNVRAMLQDKYEIFVATSGTQVITFAQKIRPDLIILDYDMPVVNGKQSLEMLRADRTVKDIPVVFLTAISDKKYVEEVVKLKPAGYLLKPPVATELISVIQRVIG